VAAGRCPSPRPTAAEHRRPLQAGDEAPRPVVVDELLLQVHQEQCARGAVCARAGGVDARSGEADDEAAGGIGPSRAVRRSWETARGARRCDIPPIARRLTWLTTTSWSSARRQAGWRRWHAGQVPARRPAGRGVRGPARPASATSALPDILARQGRLPASHAKDLEPIESGHVYVAPPDRRLLLQADHVHLSRVRGGRSGRPCGNGRLRRATPRRRVRAARPGRRR
jgi:CheB methylesterase